MRRPDALGLDRDGFFVTIPTACGWPEEGLTQHYPHSPYDAVAREVARHPTRAATPFDRGVLLDALAEFLDREVLDAP